MKIKQAMTDKYGDKKGDEVFKKWCNTHDITIETKKLPYEITSKNLTFQTDGIATYVERKGESKKYYVTGYISTSDIDKVNDIVMPEALDDMVTQIKDGNIKLDVEHEAYKKDSTTVPIGKIVEAKRDEKGIWVKAELNDASTRFKEIWGSLKKGMIDAFSITFRPIEAIDDMVNGEKVRKLMKVLLFNVALTGNACNEHATITQVLSKNLKEALKMADEKTIEKKDEGTPEAQPPTEPATPPEGEPAKGEPEKKEEKPKEGDVAVVEKKTLDSALTKVDALTAEVKSLSEKVEKKEKLEGTVDALTKQVAELKEKIDAPVMKATAETAPAEPTEAKPVDVLSIIH